MTISPTTSSHAAGLATAIKAQARSLGFDLVGITNAQPSAYRDYLRTWLDSGQAGSMEYLSKRFDERVDPAVYLPGAKSVICVAMNYHTPLEATGAVDRSQAGRVARYALGDDYHEVVKQKLHLLADWLRTLAPDAITRAAVDTAPLMEKELAARAGIGWMGKNTCIINTEIGSWLFLGEIVTTLELPADSAAIDRCGSCTRCIDACPTDALTAPYQLDARKCISYLTIEHRDEIAPHLQSQIGDWLYGCDICQDVCPWNRDALATVDPAFEPRFKTGALDISEVLQWSDDEYRASLRHSAIKRVKLPVLKRNAKIVSNNLDRPHATNARP